MADGDSSDEEKEIPTAARLPTQVRTTNSPFRKLVKVTQSQKQSSKNKDGRRDKSSGRRVQGVPDDPQPSIPPPSKKKPR